MMSDDMLISQFKSFLLTKTKNKKFRFDHLMSNDQSILDLKNRILEISDPKSEIIQVRIQENVEKDDKGKETFKL